MYCLLASGLTIVYGVLGVPNLAQGHLYMLAAYMGFYLVMSFLMSYWLALVLAAIAMGLLGILMYRFVFHPMEMRQAPHANLFVAAVAILLVMEGAALLWFGGETKWLILPFSRTVMDLGGVALPVQRLIIILATIVVMIALQLFIKRTSLGVALEATAQNHEGAMLCGIRVTWIGMMAFFIGTGLAGVAGVLIAPTQMILPSMGFGPLVIAFAVVMFGGVGSLPGAVVASVVVGLVESLASGYISATYSLVFVFAIMIVTLLLLPRGLMGKEIR